MIFHCWAKDDESYFLDTIGVFPDPDAAQMAINAWLEEQDTDCEWDCGVTECIIPASGQGLCEYNGQERRWTYELEEEE